MAITILFLGRRNEGGAMTEADSELSADPQMMLVFLRLRGTVTERQVRLLKAAWCRRIWLPVGGRTGPCRSPAYRKELLTN
jgi:hypothetical protein